MARKVATVTITSEGRDKGKVFQLTEMSATQGEKWAARALLALAHAKVDIPTNIEDAGMAGMAIVGLQALAGAAYSEVEPLMDEMMGCIAYIPEPGKPFVRALEEDDIEEVSTRLQLKAEVFALHTGFSLLDAILRSQNRGTMSPPISGTTSMSTE